MRQNQDVIQFHIANQELIETERFRTLEEYVNHLVHQRAYEEVASMAENRVVLDLGCNVGYGTKVIGAVCSKAVGVDVSPRAVEEAMRRSSKGNVEFRLVDGKRLPFEDRSFDLVASFQVIEHVDDYAPYLSEIRRVLSPSGRAVFTTPNAVIRLDPGMKPHYPFHVREFSAHDLRTLLQGYFPHVEIRGLFAIDDLYAIEFNRCNNARISFRNRDKWTFRLNARVRSAIPGLVKDELKDILRRIQGQPLELDPAILGKYSTGDFYYREDNLDESLDLMAICHQDECSSVS